MRYHRPLAVLCAAVALVLTLAACGSSQATHTVGPSTGASASSSTAAAGTAVSKGAAIKIGLICTCSGPQQANGATRQVAQTWQAWTNARGGLNGHPVDVIFKDDGGDPATSLQDAQALVQGDHVMAIAGENSLADASWEKYVEEQKIPVVGGIPYEPTMFSSPVFFPSGASLPAEFYAMIATAKAQGLNKLGTFYCAETPTCAEVPPLIGAIAAKVIGGVALVNSEKLAAASPNFTAQCLAAKQAGVQAIFVAESPAIGQRVFQQCAQQGFHPKYIGINGVLPFSAASTGNYNGAIVAHGNLPITNTTVSGTAELAAALAKYAPGVTSNPTWNSNPTDSWAGLQLFAAAATAGKLTPASTPADVMAALYSLKNETLGGLSGPLNFTKGQPTLAACPFIAEIKSGKWVTPNGTKPTCVPPAKLALLGDILRAAG